MRVLMRSIVETDGIFEAEHFRAAYVRFMTTPGSHNDAYASTCHRMFFANLEAGKAPEQCPDNDRHNVDTIDGLVLPTVAALGAAAAAGGSDPNTAAAECVAVTRDSESLQKAARVWAGVIAALVTGYNVTDLQAMLDPSAQTLGLQRRPSSRRADEMSACYLSDSLQTLFDMLAKYAPAATGPGGVWRALLANANVGGENVHRGAVLGAALGAAAGFTNLDRRLVDGLAAKDQLASEIDAFVHASWKRVRS